MASSDSGIINKLSESVENISIDSYLGEESSRLPESRDVRLDKVDKLNKNIGYHRESMQYYTSLKREYIENGDLHAYAYQETHKLPKKPEVVKFSLTGGDGRRHSTESTTKPLDQLRGVKLLDELKKPENLRSDVKKGGNVAEFDPQESDETVIQNKIKEGEEFVVYKQKLILRDAVQLGLWIERYCELSEESFTDFVENTCQFSVSWAYKIRSYATVFAKYPKLQQLNISLTTAIKICKNVDRALSAYPNHARFWSCKLITPGPEVKVCIFLKSLNA